METEAPPSESPKKQESCSPPAVPGGEESEAKLRERLIERTKRLRGAVTEKTPAIPDTETHTQVWHIMTLPVSMAMSHTQSLFSTYVH